MFIQQSTGKLVKSPVTYNFNDDSMIRSLKDLIRMMTHFEPEKRSSAQQVLNHLVSKNMLQSLLISAHSMIPR